MVDISLNQLKSPYNYYIRKTVLVVEWMPNRKYVTNLTVDLVETTKENERLVL